MPSKGVEMRLVGIYFSRLSTREINFPTRLISTFPWKVLNNHLLQKLWETDCAIELSLES